MYPGIFLGGVKGNFACSLKSFCPLEIIFLIELGLNNDLTLSQQLHLMAPLLLCMFENLDFPLPSLLSILHDAVGMAVWQMTLCMSPLGSSIHVSMQTLYCE